jgi:O-antigen ligase
MGILKKLIIVTIVLFPVGEFGRYLFPSFATAPILLNDLLVTVTVMWWIGLKVKEKKLPHAKLRLPIVLFILTALISLIANSLVLSFQQVFISSLYLWRWSMYAGLYCALADIDTHFKKRIVVLLMIVGQIVVGIGFIQYFFYPSLRNLYYLGWDEHLYRIFSVFLDPNFAGVIFVLIFLLTLGIGLQKYHEKKHMLCIGILFLSFFDIIAVYLTYSRSALLMLIVSIFFFLWFLGKQKYIAGVFMALLLLLFIAPKSFKTEGTNIFRIASSESRIESAKTALEIIQKNPLFGVGFNAYRYAQNRYGYLTNKYWIETHAGAGTDNSYLFVLATTGVVGVTAYIYLLLQMIRLASQKKDIVHVVTVSSLFGIFVSSLFINSLFYIFIMEWLWILLGTRENK